MARVSNFRAVIVTASGEASRLGNGAWCRVALNTRDNAAHVSAHRDASGAESWTLSLAPVESISSNGARCGADFARVTIESDSLAALREGRAALRVITREEESALAALREGSARLARVRPAKLAEG